MKKIFSFLKNKKILFLFVFFVFLSAGGFYCFEKFFKKEKNTPSSSLISPKKEEKNPCPLTGQLLEKEKAQRWPVAVIVENHPDARPQSGLQFADIVYEALAEGGITRFLAFFHCQEVKEIGPVRSLRPYFLKWAAEKKAVLAYIGGSSKALRMVSRFPVYDLNQFFNAQYFWRSKERRAPHNLYTSTAKLFKAVEEKFHLGNFNGHFYKFKTENQSEPQGTIKAIQIDYSYSKFLVKWEFSSSQNAYLRFQGGKAFKEKLTDKQIEAKNVVVMWVKTYPEDQEGRLAMDLEGQGKAQIFQEGRMIEAIWKKPSESAQTLFFDKEGKEIEFVPGNIWIEVVPENIKVSVF